ncbi:MAG: queuosine precursor transporter [Janthinobacterium lividum]
MNKKEEIYILLCVIFVALMITSNMTYQKFVYLSVFNIHTFQLSAGAIFYPLTFLVSDLIIEFYDVGKAKFCLKLSILISFVVSIMIYFIAELEAVPWSKINDELFKLVFTHFGIAFLASMIASYVAQFVDIHIYTLIRKLTADRYLWLRNNFSSAVSLLIDTAIVTIFLAFFGILPQDQIDNLILNSYLFKLLFTVCATPLFYGAYYLIKRKIKFIR